MSRPPKLRNWVFRIDLPSQFQYNDDVAIDFVTTLFEPHIEELDSLKYIVFQLEKGAENGKYHIQGYAELKKPVERNWILRKWPHFDTDPTDRNSTWVRPRAQGATREQAIDYAKKEETRVAGPWEVGSLATQGTRSDLSEIGAKLFSKVPLKRIAEEHPSSFIRYGQGIRRLASDVLNWTTCDWHPCIIVFYGDSNAGKTYAARSFAGPDHYQFMVQHGSTVWWDGYEGQEDVVFQDWGRGAISLRDFLCLWDNGIRVNVKHGTTKLMPKRVWITGNPAPHEWYDNCKDNRKAIYRRISYCYLFKGDYEEGTVRVTIDTKPLSVSPEYPEGRLWCPTQPVAFDPNLVIRNGRLEQPVPVATATGPTAISPVPVRDEPLVTAIDLIDLSNTPPSAIVEEETGSTDNDEIRFNFIDVLETPPATPSSWHYSVYDYEN